MISRNSKTTSILLIISLFFSCSTHKKERISKLVYISGRGISYDSLNHPQLSLLKYFEYSNNHFVKLAKGKDYNSYKDGHLQFGKALPFSLNEFFTVVIPEVLIENINDVLIDNSFDSIYDSKLEGWHYEYLIFETTGGKKKVIEFDKDSLPANLRLIYIRIEDLFSKDLNVAENFKVDTSIVELQSELFSRFPPPPPPATIEQQIRYRPPNIIKKDNRWQIQKKDGRSGFIDSLGNEIFIDSFDFLDDYKDGLAFFQKVSQKGWFFSASHAVKSI